MKVVSACILFCTVANAAPTEIPVSESADVFLIDVDADDVGDVAVLEDFVLTIYPTANRSAPRTLNLPKNATAFDITTDPATGKTVALAVCGNEIRRFGFASNSDPDGQRLFEHRSYLSDAERPYRYVLTFERDGEPLFFLPSADAIELRTWTGEVRDRILPEPAGGAQFESMFGFPTNYVSFGGPNAIGFRAARRPDNEPALIESQRAHSPEPDTTNVLLELGRFDVLELPPDEWPWFALQPGVENSARVRSANRANPGETHIRIDTTFSDNGTISPARKYPGLITRLNAELPDFNGDGYTDLLLWNTDRPSVSVSTIARMAVQQDWPIRLTVHVYDPVSGRYVAKPFAALDVRATWDILMRSGYDAPLDATVIDDLDGDGRTDLAFTADAHTYTLWMMGETTPCVEDVKIREPIRDLSFAQPLDDSGSIAIGLRTKSTLYVIDPD